MQSTQRKEHKMEKFIKRTCFKIMILKVKIFKFISYNPAILTLGKQS